MTKEAIMQWSKVSLSLNDAVKARQLHGSDMEVTEIMTVPHAIYKN